MKKRNVVGFVVAAGLLAGACLLAPVQAFAAPGDQLSLTAIGQFFFPARRVVTTAAGARRIDLLAIVDSDKVGIDIFRITNNTDYKVDASFVCTGGRQSSPVYSGDDPVSSLDDRFLLCGLGRRGQSIFGAIGIFEP